MTSRSLKQIAMATRLFLEPVWETWHRSQTGHVPATASTNTCGRSSLFLRNVLRSEGFSADWTTGTAAVFGQSLGHSSFGFEREYLWKSHAWVTSGGMIVDITADQFGSDRVIVTPTGDTRYSPSGIDTAYPSAIRARHDAVNALWINWLSSREHLLNVATRQV